MEMLLFHYVNFFEKANCIVPSSIHVCHALVVNGVSGRHHRKLVVPLTISFPCRIVVEAKGRYRPQNLPSLGEGFQFA